MGCHLATMESWIDGCGWCALQCGFHRHGLVWRSSYFEKRRQLYPIQLDIAEVETALFNVKMASDLAVSQILTRWNLFSDWIFHTWIFIFIFLRQHGHWNTVAGCIVDSLKNYTVVFGKHKISLCTFDIQMLFLNKVYVLVFFSWLCFISWFNLEITNGYLAQCFVNVEVLQFSSWF